MQPEQIHREPGTIEQSARLVRLPMSDGARDHSPNDRFVTFGHQDFFRNVPIEIGVCQQYRQQQPAQATLRTRAIEYRVPVHLGV